MEKVSPDEAFASIDEQWSPHIAAELNGQAVKLATVEGEFVWHHHDDADELFMVLDGALTIELRDEPDVELEPGEFVVVPSGVEHRPVADEATRIMLFEPAGTTNTGNVTSDRTVEAERLE
ncbi:cupin domain-containing protein [Halorarum salinum]|uniref:Cupin domain-containing protein n=1 Tax=Halorarum salinum TaxID=2743089 RepID=A0A7D5QCR6_9EURY|nr:cupin domain-containing protein [Halobaculum salinum]QLG63937.1 cupin domain-containing protein [Halobaculum salinum]